MDVRVDTVAADSGWITGYSEVVLNGLSWPTNLQALNDP
jgi:hypothetical protein